MKKLAFLFFALSCAAQAAPNIKVDDLVFYHTDYDRESGKYRFAAYILKSDPCIYVKKQKDDTAKRYCGLGESGMNLEHDSPSIYASEILVYPGNIYFTVAAPWNEQKCRIEVYKDIISCKPTGN